MPKLNEMSDLTDRASKLSHAVEIWASWNEARLQTLNQITNYLFVLNSGALIGCLTYVAFKAPNFSTQCAIWLFAAGVLCSVFHAALDYSAAEYSFTTYKLKLGQFYANSLDWTELIKEDEKQGKLDWCLHILGWVGGIAFIVGVFVGITQIR